MNCQNYWEPITATLQACYLITVALSPGLPVFFGAAPMIGPPLGISFIPTPKQGFRTKTSR